MLLGFFKSRTFFVRTFYVRTFYVAPKDRKAERNEVYHILIVFQKLRKKVFFALGMWTHDSRIKISASVPLSRRRLYTACRRFNKIFEESRVVRKRCGCDFLSHQSDKNNLSSAKDSRWQSHSLRDREGRQIIEVAKAYLKDLRLTF